VLPRNVWNLRNNSSYRLLGQELTNSISIVISRERGERVLEERLAADNAGDTEASPRGHGTAED
jgi:hypothetical protein